VQIKEKKLKVKSREVKHSNKKEKEKRLFHSKRGIW